MLLAYIDEIGEPGAFISPDHPKFRTSPAFGYAGFIIPEDKAREFGAIFAREKAKRFSLELKKVENPSRWEYKGANFFRPDTPTSRPENLRIFTALVKTLTSFGGRLFYYADEKPIGTPKQTQLDPAQREGEAMRETINRLARYAEKQSSNVMVMIDSINEKTRAERVANIYAHVFARSSEFDEMRRIIEPPMHIDSALSSNIQFADWVAAYITRALDYQLIKETKYNWIAQQNLWTSKIYGSFTSESKLHFYERSVEDIHNTHVLDSQRPLYPIVAGQQVGSSVNPVILRRIKAAAEKSREN